MFEIGDRVRCIVECPDDNESITIGSTGTVCGLDEYDSIVYVDWDDDVCGHNCYGLAKESHGWNVRESDIELMDDGIQYEFDDSAFKSLILGVK